MMLAGTVERDLNPSDLALPERARSLQFQEKPVRDHRRAVADSFLFAGGQQSIGELFDNLESRERLATVPGDAQAPDLARARDHLDDRVLDGFAHRVRRLVFALKAIIAAEV